MLKQIKDWEILTPDGWSDFDGINVENSQKIIELVFENKIRFQCTEDHKLFLTPKKKIRAINCLNKKILCQNNKKIQVIKINKLTKNSLVFDVLNVKQQNRYYAGKNNLLISNCLLIDECAHIDRFKEDEFVKSIMPVISSSSQTKIFMISTPNGTANHFYKIYSGAERKENGWYPEKIDWQEIPGRDEAWKLRAIADLGSIEAFEQEYNNRFIETGETAIDKEIISEFRHSARTADVLNTNEYKVWESPNPDNIYVIGGDVSDGVGGAASTLQGLNITDLTNIKQAFTYSNRFIDTSHFAKETFDIAKQWGKPPILMERNSMGGEVINFLTGRPYNYERMVSYNSSQQIDYEKGGIYSSTNVKYEGISNMRYWMNSLRALNIFDIATIQELETFVKYPNGTWHKQPGAGLYDDRVMALVWALFALHTTIAETLFEIVKYDERGKPLKIKQSYYDSDTDSFYGLGQYRHDYGDADFVPSFVGTKRNLGTNSNDNPEMEDLVADGWKLLSNI